MEHQLESSQKLGMACRGMQILFWVDGYSWETSSKIMCFKFVDVLTMKQTYLVYAPIHIRPSLVGGFNPSEKY